MPASAGSSRIQDRASLSDAGVRTANRQLIVFSFWGVALGIIGAVTAWALYHLINIFTGLAWFRTFTLATPLYPPPQGIGLMTIVIPIIGALIVGVMAKYGTDRIRGHGIPEAMEAVLRQKSRVSVRVAFFKPISAAIAVGTGGPFGAEGPIIQTGGAIGSLIGQTRRMSAAERRILLACGGAAGMVGIFNTPIAAVALAVELLLFEFRARSLIPVVLASATAAACRVYLIGSKPMFGLGNFPTIGGSVDLLWFLPLGIIIGVLAVVISKALYVIEEWFDHLHIDLIFKPALGALVLGIVAFFQPRVLGMGYTYITDTLQGHYANGTLLSLGVGKSIALVFSLGAGTSGGLLAPMLLIGATVGVGFGRGVHALIPAAGISPALCGIVAMSSLFSAAARAPLTSFLFAFELTGDYRAILPLMVGCMVADVVARALSTESVMTERLARRGLRIRQDYETAALQGVQLSEIMTRRVDALDAGLLVGAALRQILGEPLAQVVLSGTPAQVNAIARGDAWRSNGGESMVNGASLNGSAHDDGQQAFSSLLAHWHAIYPVVNSDGSVRGMVSREDLLRAARDPDQRDTSVGTIAKPEPVQLYPRESALAAFDHMLAQSKTLLPVVDNASPHRLIGVVGTHDLLQAWKMRHMEEYHRERILRFPLTGWNGSSTATTQEHMTSRRDTELVRHARDTLTPETTSGDVSAAPEPEEPASP